MWDGIGDGWLLLLDYTLERLWDALEPEDRDELCITHVRRVGGDLVIQADIGGHCYHALRLIDDVREASRDICTSCGEYAAVQLPRPLCRGCLT